MVNGIRFTVYISSFLMFSLMMFHRVAQAEEAIQKTIAILTLQVKGQNSDRQSKLTSTEADHLTDLTRAIFSHLPKEHYLIMSQENIEVLLPDEQTLEDCQGSCAVETARLLQAHWIITGSVAYLASEFKYHLKLHHSQSGQFLLAETGSTHDFNQLEQLLKESALKLAYMIDQPFKKQLVKDSKTILLKYHVLCLESREECQKHHKVWANRVGLKIYIAALKATENQLKETQEKLKQAQSDLKEKKRRQKIKRDRQRRLEKEREEEEELARQQREVEREEKRLALQKRKDKRREKARVYRKKKREEEKKRADEEKEEAAYQKSEKNRYKLSVSADMKYSSDVNFNQSSNIDIFRYSFSYHFLPHHDVNIALLFNTPAIGYMYRRPFLKIFHLALGIQAMIDKKYKFIPIEAQFGLQLWKLQIRSGIFAPIIDQKFGTPMVYLGIAWLFFK